ncbi:hypothetical protein Y032_0584g311 [Ancylostoma ceylanicum]|uniref:Uncharacterized protein n=1 Tax=Ancylostoma ceylanicum TaxID=53326 RepID=A0A016WPZ1_9BILA|nr:hypothetical protein Y032_0584g311 [Ancylostoma ceylanicum]
MKDFHACVKDTMAGRQLHAGFPGTNTLHSEQCRAEIQRFESVHPCIYQIYDMLECLPLPPEYAHMRDEIRDQVVCIEDAFVNSHEWTLSRSVSELRLVSRSIVGPYLYLLMELHNGSVALLASFSHTPCLKADKLLERKLG